MPYSVKPRPGIDSLFLRRNWRIFLTATAQAVDTAVIAGSFIVAAVATHPEMSVYQILATHVKLLIFSIIVFVTLYTAFGQYRKVAYTSIIRQIFQAGRVYLISMATIFSALFLTQNLYYSRSFLFYFFLLIPVFHLVGWLFLRGFIHRLTKLGVGVARTLVVGPKQELKGLLYRLDEHPNLGYQVAKVINTPVLPNRDGEIVIDPSTVATVLKSHHIDLIVLSSYKLNGAFESLQEMCRQRHIPMRVVSKEADRLFTKARLYDFAGIPLYQPPRTRITFIKRVTKRAFDIVGATLGLIILSPLFLVVAIATKIESHGPVFFTQKRSLTGDDEPFDFVKFRSMHHEADHMKETLFKRNEADGALFKMKNDPRLTRVGRIIRKYSIDELPQLINVLKGEMSLVGPRPLPASDYKRMKKEDHMGGYFRNRADVKPGMTGLWQISGRSDVGFREMVLLDLYYVENQNLLFDFEILAQTIPVVLFGKGAY